ncbi:hypothetical protein Tco_0862427, partial [Tanacetum coccineum]
MPPTMTTRNFDRRTMAPRGERTGRQTGKGGGRTGDQGGLGGGRGNGMNGDVDEVPDFSIVIAQQLQALLPTIVTQVGDISNQGINESQNDNAADDSIHEDDRNVNVNNGQNVCSYKEFVACKPKEFDGKGGVVAYTRWVKKMGAVQDMSGYGDNHKVKYSAGLLIGIDERRILPKQRDAEVRNGVLELSYGGNHPNQALAIEGGQGRRNNGNPAHGRSFMMGAEDARQDPNIVT